MSELRGFTDKELHEELDRRVKFHQDAFLMPLERTEFGIAVNLDLKLSGVGEQIMSTAEYAEDRVPLDPDTILVLGQTAGSEGLRPLHVCLPHQLYVETVNQLLDKHQDVCEIWVQPLWSQARFQVTGVKPPPKKGKK